MELSVLKSKRPIILLCVTGLFMASIILVGSVSAQTPEPPQGSGAVQPLNFPPPPEPVVANETCLACHAQPDQYYALPSGEQLYLTIDDAGFNHSVHGKDGYACVQCHTNLTGYPHPPITAQTRREFNLAYYPSCARCHRGMYDLTLDSVHEKALEAGNLDAAVCTDCHGNHYVQPPDEPRSNTAQMCERCHSVIYNDYKQSVHGAALIDEGNPDVPTCIDCHGVHNVQGPSTGPFHLYSPLICAECHADDDLMEKYGISTKVFSTYVSDFHGKTVIFDQLAPGQETNKPVCVDCHGVHNILPPNDPHSSVMKDNLLTTCQRCHPDATQNFPTSWLGHYVPDRDKYPLVYFVDLFYKIFIPTVLGGMALLVVGDAGRRIINHRKKVRND